MSLRCWRTGTDWVPSSGITGRPLGEESQAIDENEILSQEIPESRTSGTPSTQIGKIRRRRALSRSSQLATGHPPPVALILVALSRKKCATDVADPRAPDRLDGSDRRLTFTLLDQEQEHEHEHHSALDPGA